MAARADPATTHTAANNALDALNETVIYNYSRPQADGTGLSVFLPGIGDTVYSGYSQLNFATETNWDVFVNALVNSGQIIA